MVHARFQIGNKMPVITTNQGRPHKWFVSTEPMVKHKGQVSSSVVTKSRTLLSEEGHKTPGSVHGKGGALAARLNPPVAYGT